MGIRVAVSLQEQSFPTGTVSGVLVFDLTGDNGYSDQQVTNDSQVDFMSATQAGTYTATVRRVNDSSQTLGTPVTGTITIEVSGSPVDTSVKVNVPAGLVLSVI